jgi:phenylpropionate dioxygenase-like ring-hydroxylating dioxygenase large terminal subunit
VALDDRCSHRNYPLSVGAFVGDEIQCGYHGLRFDSCGNCVWAPGQERIPSRANVPPGRSSSVVPWVWVWMGDPSAADPDRKLPAMAWLDDPNWATVHGVEPLAARAGLLIDNLLDLSHETFLHAGYIGTPRWPRRRSAPVVEGNVVHVSRRMEAVECPPFYSESTGLTTPIDRWQDIEYHAPGCYLLHVRVAPAGSDEGAAHVEVMYAITPVDEHNTLDFWAVSRDFAVGDPAVDAFLERMNREVVLQDVEALELIEARMAGAEWQPEVSFKIDTGGLAARRCSPTSSPQLLEGHAGVLLADRGLALLGRAGCTTARPPGGVGRSRSARGSGAAGWSSTTRTGPTPTRGAAPSRSSSRGSGCRRR